jgi:hypothetical protein
MRGRHPRVDGVVLGQIRQNLNSTRSVAPIPHKVTDDAEEANELHARRRHAVVGDVADECGCRAGCLDIGPDVVAFGAQREGAESGACGIRVSGPFQDKAIFSHPAESNDKTLTDVRGDPGQYDLLLARCSDCFAELGVVPSIDFALAGNERRTRIPGQLMSVFVYTYQSTNSSRSHMSRIALGRGPFGPSWDEVDRITGKSNSFPMLACAIMEL